MYGSGQQFIRSLRALFGQDRGAENVVRFAYHVAQCFQIVLFACHEQTVAPRRCDCNRLLFSINATLGHYPLSASQPHRRLWKCVPRATLTGFNRFNSKCTTRPLIVSRLLPSYS